MDPNAQQPQQMPQEQQPAQANPMAQAPQGQQQTSPLEQYNKIYEDLRTSLLMLMHQGMPGIDKILEATTKAQTDLIKSYKPTIGDTKGAGGLSAMLGQANGGAPQGPLPQAPQQ